jgi:hypothetical protein
LLPKIHKNNMLPPRWMIEPCMNIDVNAVSTTDGWPGTSPQAIASP